MDILVVDVGTTSMRGILFADGRMLHTATRATPLLHEGGTIEQKPSLYIECLVSICREIAAKAPVDALSVTAFRSAPTLVNEAGEALCNFIMWQDTRNKAICERLYPQHERVRRLCGAKVNTVFTATKVRWLRENRPETYQSAYKAMVVPDYLICHMTGAFVTDRTYGSRWHLMNIHTLQWDDELCAIFGVEREKLCTLIDQGTVAGCVNAAFHRETGIPEGTPVVSAGGDQQCGALGLGVWDETQLEVNSGTGSFVISTLGEPYLEQPNVICNVAAIKGRYTLESNIMASASSLDWLLRGFYPDLWGEKPDYEAANRLAEASPPGANGVLCLPHFQGCGTRDWNPGARAAFWGLSLSSARGDLLRALYEGLAGEIAKSVDALPEASRACQSVRVAGGLTGSALYNQILADTLGRELSRYQNAQATAIGAYASAAVALQAYCSHAEALAAVRRYDRLETYVPDARAGALYRRNMARTERVYRQLSLDGEAPL